MAEYPFTLTLRQAVRILLEYLALTILACLALAVVSHLLERFAGFPELGLWPAISAARPAATFSKAGR